MKLGHLYVVNTTLTNPPKDKLVICVCAQNNLFLWINTLPRHHGIAQFGLAAADHAALTHACFLDCSRVTTFRAAELSAAIDRGKITNPLAQAIRAFIDANPPKTMPPKQRELILANLATI